MKGLLSAKKKRFIGFMFVRLCLSTQDFIVPMLQVKFMEWLTNDEPDTYESICIALIYALGVPIYQTMCHYIWEFFCFYMVETGHLAHISLKTMLFAKNLRMSNATNKDFDSS